MAGVAQNSRSAETARTQVRRGKRSPAPAPPPGKAGESHAVELWGLACLGLAVFLIFVLVAGEDTGGILGGAAAGALATVFGRLAFLVPLALIQLAVMLIGKWRPRPAKSVVAGGLLVLFSVGLLVAAGFPPFGPGHDSSAFVSELYRVRAGWLGEGVFVLGRNLIGEVGVTILGWLCLLGGASLLTGWTLRRALASTGEAAKAVGNAAAEKTRRMRGEPHTSGPLDDPYLTGFGPAQEPAAARDDVFDELDFGPPGGLVNPPLRVVGRGSGSARLRDAATDFPDLYQEAPLSGLVDGEAAAGAPAPAGRPEGAGDGSPRADSPSSLAAAAEPVGEQGAAGRATASAAPDAVAAARTEPPAAGDAAEEIPAITWTLPAAELLRKSQEAAPADMKMDASVSSLLVETLAHFGVDARVCGTVIGPRVTRYELQLAPGTKVSKVANLKDDLAYALASTEIRILAPIPGKSAVGVEVPNRRPQFVTLGDIYRDFPAHAGPLMVWLGKDISGRAMYTDLTKMPHLLIAGTTGSGKSGCINCLISSILLRATPDQVRMVLVDPKKVELSHYERIPHLLVPVVTNMKNAAGVLNNLVREMDERYTLMEMVKARSLEEMNRIRVRKGELALPYLLIVIDELADLMMVSPAEVEDYVIRIAQKARAVGIHLVVATQRPSADVITGMIKANIPSRIAFAVSSQTDSRVILDVNGAETLLGMGDMLFRPLGSSRLQRIQGAFITEEEIHLLTTSWRRQAEPAFREELLISPEEAMAEEAVFDPDSDELLADAAELVLDTGNASVSMLQRRLRVGYTRAGRLIDMLERRGIVGPYEGSKPRQVLVRPPEREHTLEALRNEAREGRPLQLSLTEQQQSAADPPET